MHQQVRDPRRRFRHRADAQDQHVSSLSMTVVVVHDRIPGALERSFYRRANTVGLVWTAP